MEIDSPNVDRTVRLRMAVTVPTSTGKGMQ